MDQPDTEVAVYRCEELRVIDDATFLAVQELLSSLKLGRRGPRKQRNIHPWYLVTDIFHCVPCKLRFYQTGAHGKGMQCKLGDLSPCKSAVSYREAAKALQQEGYRVNSGNVWYIYRRWYEMRGLRQQLKTGRIQ